MYIYFKHVFEILWGSTKPGRSHYSHFQGQPEEPKRVGNVRETHRKTATPSSQAVNVQQSV